MSELYHFGRSKKDGAPVGSGRYPLGSGSNNKNKSGTFTLSRYSSVREDKIRKGSYFFVDDNKDDSDRYLGDFFEGNLSGKSSNNTVYKMTIESVSPIVIRSGKDTVSDIVSKIKNEDVKNSYNVLKNKGFFDDRAIGWNNESMHDDRLLLARGIHAYVYNNRENLADVYKKAGYDAVVDPEDYVNNFILPLIVTNPDKFRIVNTIKGTLNE